MYAIVTAPVADDTLMLDPATAEVTPVFVIVEFPVDPLIDIPVPPILLNTPSFCISSINPLELVVIPVPP